MRQYYFTGGFDMKSRAYYLRTILVSIVIGAALIAGLILYFTVQDESLRSMALAMALFPIGLFVAAWLFFVGIPGVIAFILVRVFSVDKARARRLAAYLLVAFFLLNGILAIFLETNRR
jgi:hypothetical protein